VKKPNFSIDLTRRKGLSDQLTEGLRRAILTGYYAEGETLPPVRALAEHFGVSLIVSCAAVKRLTAEGLIVPRPHIGSVVAPKNAKLWKGRILLVRIGQYGSYYQDVFEGGFGERLAKEGWLLESLVLRLDANGRVQDFSRLDFLLREKPDFVVQMYENTAVSARLKKAGVRYSVVCVEGKAPADSLGNIRQNRFAAIADLAARCRASGVRSVIQLGAEPHPGSLSVLRAAGLSVAERTFPPCKDFGLIEGVERAGMEAVLRHFARGKKHRPDLYLLTDDFFAQGVLTAFLSVGVRVPDDVFVVTMSNKGLGPVFPKTLTRFEMDGAAHGAMTADYVLARMKGLPVQPLVLAADYISGETFPF